MRELSAMETDTSQESSAKSYEQRRLRLAQQLLEARTSQAELGKLAQVTVFTVNRCLTGKRIVKESTLRKLEAAMSDILAGQRRTRMLNQQRGQAGPGLASLSPAMLAGGGLLTTGFRAGSLSDSSLPSYDANQEVRGLRETIARQAEHIARQAEYIELVQKVNGLLKESNDMLSQLVENYQADAQDAIEEAKINRATIEGFLQLRQKDPAATTKK